MKQGKVAAQGDFQTLASKEFLQTIFETDIVSYFQKQNKSLGNYSIILTSFWKQVR